MPSSGEQDCFSFNILQVRAEAETMFAFARRNDCLDQIREDIAVSEAEASALRTFVKGDPALEMQAEMALAFRDQVALYFDRFALAEQGRRLS